MILYHHRIQCVSPHTDMCMYNVWLCVCVCASNEIHVQCTLSLDSHHRANLKKNRNNIPYDNGIETVDSVQKGFESIYLICAMN